MCESNTQGAICRSFKNTSALEYNSTITPPTHHPCYTAKLSSKTTRPTKILNYRSYPPADIVERLLPSEKVRTNQNQIQSYIKRSMPYCSAVPGSIRTNRSRSRVLTHDNTFCQTRMPACTRYTGQSKTINTTTN